MTSEENPTLSAPDHADVDAQARAWARHLAVGRPTTLDAQAFRQWLVQSSVHAQAWAAASREWRDIEQVAVAFRARHPQGDAPPRKEKMPVWGRRAFMGAALSSAGALGVLAMVRPPLDLWPSWSELNSDYRTRTGEQRTVDVNDHIHLVLNTQTSIAVRTGGPVPCVELVAGEAAVRARGGEPLDVVAGVGTIRIAEAGIEVRTLAQGTRVICSEGQAELRHRGRTLVLQTGQEVFYDHDQLDMPLPRRVRDESSWRDGMVTFDATPLDEAVAEINRYRPGRVVLLNDAVARQRISGRFRISALDQAIRQIETLYGVRARSVGDVTLLS